MKRLDEMTREEEDAATPEDAPDKPENLLSKVKFLH